MNILRAYFKSHRLKICTHHVILSAPSLSWIPGCNLEQMISLPACFPDDQREENFLGVNLNDDL